MKSFVTICLLTLLGLNASAQKTAGLQSKPAGRQIVSFFPNPAVSTINFEFKSEVSKGAVLQVYNFLGRKLVNAPLNNSQRISVNVSDYMRGIYIFQLVDAAGRLIETNKFQVSR